MGLVKSFKISELSFEEIEPKGEADTDSFVENMLSEANSDIAKGRVYSSEEAKKLVEKWPQATAVIWTEKALRMLSEIAAYKSEYVGLPKANQFQIELINEIDSKLFQFPKSFPPCRFLKLRKAGCRCCTYKKEYIVIYYFVDNIVQGYWSDRR